MKTRNGVVVRHNCGNNIFMERKTIEGICAFVCSKCGDLVEISTFGSTMKKQMLDNCENWTEEEIKKRVKGE